MKPFRGAEVEAEAARVSDRQSKFGHVRTQLVRNLPGLVYINFLRRRQRYVQTVKRMELSGRNLEGLCQRSGSTEAVSQDRCDPTIR